MSNGHRDPDIDLAIAVLDAVTPRGHTWKLEEIAEICGCSRQCIHMIERRALNKLKRNRVLQSLMYDNTTGAESASNLPNFD